MDHLHWFLRERLKSIRPINDNVKLNYFNKFNKPYVRLLDVKRRYLMLLFCTLGVAVIGCTESALEETILYLRPIDHGDSIEVSQCLFNQIESQNESQNSGDILKFSDIDYAIFRAYYFTGRGLMALPATLLAELVGPKFGMFLGVFGSSVTIAGLFFSNPINCKMCLNIIRMVQGIWQSIYVTAISVCVARWVPPQENSFSVAVVYSSILVPQILPSLVIFITYRKERKGMLQWEGLLSFYILWGFWWSALFFLSAASLPESDPFLSREEHDYLQTYIDSRLPPHWWSVNYPWKQLLTSLPVWVGIFANIGSEIIIYTNFHYFAEYFTFAFKLNRRQMSMVQMCVGVSTVMMAVGFGLTADQLINRKGYSKDLVRKVYAVVGIWIPVFGMIFGPLITLHRCEKKDTLAFIGALAPFVSMTLSSQSVNMLDLTPRFAGMAGGFVITFQSIGNIVFNLLAGYILNSEDIWHPWILVFFLVGSISILSTYIFVIWGRTDIQSWDSTGLQSVADQEIE